MKRELSDEEIVATIFDKLARRKKWKHSYLPTESLVKWIASKLKRNGKRVWKIVDELIKKGFLLTKKSGAVVSLNPLKYREIMEIRKKVFKT